jgi:hypothetical protein
MIASIFFMPWDLPPRMPAPPEPTTLGAVYLSALGRGGSGHGLFQLTTEMHGPCQIVSTGHNEPAEEADQCTRTPEHESMHD